MLDKRILYQGSLQIDKAEDDIYKQALLKGFYEITEQLESIIS